MSCYAGAIHTRPSPTWVESDEAIKFLKEAPDTLAVLKGYASRLQPRSGWSGSEADTMQPRADAIKALLSYPDAAIAKAAETVVFETTKWIERIRQREQQRDEEREQTFE